MTIFVPLRSASEKEAKFLGKAENRAAGLLAIVGLLAQIKIMTFIYKDLLPFDFSGNSRVWIYQSNRPFSPIEALRVEEKLYAFTSTWQTHGTPVKGYGILLFGQFIVLMADETGTNVSGCSTDSSVHLIKKIEEDFEVSLFDRHDVAFIIDDSIRVIPFSKLKEDNENEWDRSDSLYFNNMVQTKEELENQWIIPVREGWLGKQTGRARSSMH